MESVDFKNDIVKLLSGDEISIKADVLKGVKQNAVQFNKIGVNFKLANKTAEEELIAELENFDVTLTMVSNGYYRCDTKIYDIPTSKNVVIIQSFKKNGNPISSNDVYQQISDNEPFLSPYAMWSIKIENVTGDFAKLKRFSNVDIDLELVGKGRHIQYNTPHICSDELENIYHLYEVISE